MKCNKDANNREDANHSTVHQHRCSQQQSRQQQLENQQQQNISNCRDVSNASKNRLASNRGNDSSNSKVMADHKNLEKKNIFNLIHIPNKHTFRYCFHFMMMTFLYLDYLLKT
jgi:hypothetical protein